MNGRSQESMVNKAGGRAGTDPHLRKSTVTAAHKREKFQAALGQHMYRYM